MRRMLPITALGDRSIHCDKTCQENLQATQKEDKADSYLPRAPHLKVPEIGNWQDHYGEICQNVQGKIYLES